MSRAHLPDEIVDAILVEPTRTQDPIRSIGRIVGPREAIVPVTTFDAFGWRSLMYLAGGVRDREGIAKDDAGFRYPGDELDPGEEPFDDVDVYNPMGEVFVSVPAFERLAARYFRALVDGAEATDDPVTRQPWWPEFVAATEEIERRVSAG
jgi:hypothetical protein